MTRRESVVRAEGFRFRLEPVDRRASRRASDKHPCVHLPSDCLATVRGRAPGIAVPVAPNGEEFYQLKRARQAAIAIVLDQDSASPLYRRIKRLGIATEGRNFQPISQATFVGSVMRYISDKPKADRDKLLRHKRLQGAHEKEVGKLPFRNLFVQERNVEIVRVLFAAFSSIKNVGL